MPYCTTYNNYLFIFCRAGHRQAAPGCAPSAAMHCCMRRHSRMRRVGIIKTHGHQLHAAPRLGMVSGVRAAITYYFLETWMFGYKPFRTKRLRKRARRVYNQSNRLQEHSAFHHLNHPSILFVLGMPGFARLSFSGGCVRPACLQRPVLLLQCQGRD
eukprot:350193-Chlamydomonas_euryale.AAC.10